MTELERMIERYHRALDEIVKGNPEPAKLLFSHREDVTLANPFGPVARGWQKVAETIDHAAANFRDGAAISFERISEYIMTYITTAFGYIVEMEHYKAKLGGSQEISPFSLRATSIIRPEDGVWKIVHRHADPITSPRPPESLIQKWEIPVTRY
jgi:ketosteroid isomerase-like protein